MRVYIDTEFTDFIACELISIGAVTEDGREFYAELTDYRKHLQSQYVADTIVPLLGQNIPNAVYSTKRDVAVAISNWIEDLGCPVEICIDYISDWDLLVDLIEDAWPSNLTEHPTNIYADLVTKIVGKCAARDANYVINGETVPEGLVTQGLAIRAIKDVFNTAFDDHFFMMQTHHDNYKQHHALFDARGNRAGYQAVLGYIENL